VARAAAFSFVTIYGMGRQSRRVGLIATGNMIAPIVA
jgi:hypothetical protein